MCDSMNKMANDKWQMNESANERMGESANQRIGESANGLSGNRSGTEPVDPIEAALKHKVAQINPDPNFVTRLAMDLRRARKLRAASKRSTARSIPLWGWLGAAIATVLVVTFAAQAFLPGRDRLPATTPEIAQAPPTTTTQPAATTAPAVAETTAPTPEPEPAFAADLPPALVSVVPRPGEEVRTQAGILLRFTRAMDRASVETALRITPETEAAGAEPVEGTFAWQDDTIVTFTPKVLAAGTRYNVALDVTAQADNGLPLTSDLVFSFSTLDALTVTRATPTSSNARGDTPVLVVFNHPMVPINCTGQVADDDACAGLPLTFNPGVVGQGTWINTSVYRFDPLPAWDAGATYTVTLAAGISSVAGATLDETVTWSFSTAPPRIVRIEPTRGSSDVPLETGVRVTFNTPMDAQATTAAFSLSVVNGNAVPGNFTWEDNNATLLFTPTYNLALDTHYVVRITEQAQAVNGGALETDRDVTFKTVPYPAILSIEGTDESTRGNTLSYYESLHIRFEGMIDSDTLEGRFRLTEDDVPTEINFWWDAYSNSAYINWEKTPGAEYCLTVLPGIADLYGNTIDEESTTCFTGGDMPTMFMAATRQTPIALDAAEAAQLYFVAVNAPRATLTLSTLNERGFLDYEGAPQTTLRRWTLEMAGRTNQTAIVPVDLAEDGGPLPTGYYHLAWNIPGAQYWWNTNLRIAVVDRHVTLKMGATEALVWVTDLRSAQPIAGAPVRLFDRSGRELGAGVTDADGIARFAIPMQEDHWANCTAVTGAPGQPGFGVARKDWNQGVSIWDFDIQADYGRPATHQVYLQTDRPIYRPAQTVEFKGVVRLDNDARYTLPPAGQTVDVAVRNPNWEIISQTQMTIDDLGTFTGQIPLAADALIGAYALEASVPGEPDRSWSINFTVSAYRKPEFEVTVTPEQADLAGGDTLRALVEAQYYAGGPASNARVHWTVRAAPFGFAPGIPGWWSWAAGDYGWMWYAEPKLIAEGDAITNDAGQFLLELPAVLEALSDSATTTGPQSWNIAATVTDESGFPVTGEGALTVHATRFYLGLKPRSWVAQAGQQTFVDLLALDWDAQPVTQQEVTISLARRTWTYVPAKQPYQSPTWTHTDTVVDTLTVSTDAAGQAEIALTPPRSGPYVVLAESQDSSGKTVRSETYLWVSGPEAAAWQMPEGQIKPVADAQSYRVGDTARVLVPTPFIAPYEVLMTVERGGILTVQRFTAQQTNLLIDIPIEDAYTPNVVVSFVAVKGVSAANRAPDVRIGMVELKVGPVEKILTVEVTPDRDTYEPGDRATLTVRTLDWRGQPVQAEVALAVVDKAVLALADPNAPSLVEAFYRPRPLGVFTGNGLIALFNRTAANIEAVKEIADRMAREMLMGGIGGGGGDGMYMADVRQDYPDTAFWEARLRTGANGEAQVTLDLPDSLTTWVADARALTADTLVGQTEVEFVVSKPLYVRPVTPRFFVAGDRAEVAALVHNNTDADLTVDVSLDTNMRIGESANQRVSVPAYGRVRVSWHVEVPTGEDVAWLTFSATGGGYRDAARPTVGHESDHALPIYRYETPDVFSTSGALTGVGSRLEAVVIPPDAGPDSYLTLRIEPTLAAGMIEGLTYLEFFPHACTEQLVSRFLPNVVSYRALKSLGIHNPELEANLQRLIAETLEEIYARQRGDEGWGWWQDRSDLQMTAYVAFALIQTQRAGFPTSANVLHRALDYLYRALARDIADNTRPFPQAFALYVLAESGHDWPEGADEALFAARDRLEVTGRAYLALALGLKDPNDPRVTTLLDDLRADAEITARGAHWESARTDAGAEYWVTSTRATALALDALARLAPDDPLIPQATRWIMVARSANRWQTTQETAWSIIALTDVMLATGELQADYAWGAAVNGVANNGVADNGVADNAAEGQVTPENLRDPVEITVPVSELLREWPNAVEISRGEGQGTLYYSADLTLYKPVEQIEAESRGITVQRQYCAVEGALDALRWDENFGDCTPINAARPGDLVEVRLTLTLPRMRHYLVVEDFYPAGMEPVDPTLNTEIQEGMEPETRQVSGNLWDRGGFWWWPTFDHEELRDERAVFYARQLAAGTYEVRYFLRAAIPGEYNVLPAEASEMYFPDVRGRSAGEVFTITP